MITIQGSFAGMNTVRNLSLIQRSLTKTMQKLSSGERINTAADGPAELVISEQMRAQIGSLTEQIKGLEAHLNRNAATDAALGELTDVVREMRQIVQTASDEATNTPETGKVLQQQMTETVAAFNRQRAETGYGNQKLLDGSDGAVVAVPQMPDLDVSTPDQAREALSEVDRVLRSVSDLRLDVGAKTKNEYESTMRSLEVASQNLTAAESTIRDTDYASEQASYLRSIVQLNVGMAAQAQGQLTSDTVFKLLHA